MTAPDAVERYYDAWINRNGDMTHVPLAEDFTFVGPVGSFDSPEGFREMAAQFGPIAQDFTVRHQFSDGDLVCSIVEWHLPQVPGTTTAAELLTVEHGALVRAEVIYDGEQLRKLAAG
ncbi:nuclear transport factor 2 family protein [Streptomyces sp. NPDC088116]|uniref:nuclear transport factor 2 family protein n=1 Tax=Streptomyces sp. NPDC088116 TaxID=3365825 RepID=UPI00381AD0D3